MLLAVEASRPEPFCWWNHADIGEGEWPPACRQFLVCLVGMSSRPTTGGTAQSGPSAGLSGIELSESEAAGLGPDAAAASGSDDDADSDVLSADGEAGQAVRQEKERQARIVRDREFVARWRERERAEGEAARARATEVIARVRAREDQLRAAHQAEKEARERQRGTPTARIELPNGLVYDGEVRATAGGNDEPHGTGALYERVHVPKTGREEWRELYRGGWDGGDRHGSGVARMPDGGTWTGQFFRGEMRGPGLCRAADGQELGRAVYRYGTRLCWASELRPGAVVVLRGRSAHHAAQCRDAAGLVSATIGRVREGGRDEAGLWCQLQFPDHSRRWLRMADEWFSVRRDAAVIIPPPADWYKPGTAPD